MSESPNYTKSYSHCNCICHIVQRPDGYQELYIENCYPTLELYVVLKTKDKILTCGTIHLNWKGWDQSDMNLLKSSEKGTSKVFYVNVNGILFGQWNDNKVVSFIFTLTLVGDGVTTW